MALFNTFLIAILTHLSQQLVAQAETIEQYTSNNGNYYVVRDDDNDHLYTWPIAQELCQSLYGTSLVSIHSSSQYTEVYGIIDSVFKPFGSNMVHRLWIGLSDQITEGDYVWIDGTNYDYTLPHTFPSTSTKDCLYFHYYDAGSIRLLSESCTSTKWSQFVCNASPPTNKPTTESPTDSPTEQPSNAPTPSTYEMIEVSGSYLCADLTANIDLLYGISYEQCVYDECFVKYAGSCVMVNYLSDTDPTRCYVMDKQCEIYDDNGSGNNIAIVGYKDACIDYPSDWTDRLSDTCLQYNTLLKYCDFGAIHVNQTAIESVSNVKSGFSALDACCECGGGVDVLDDVTIYFSGYTENTLCSWPYGNPPGAEAYRTWSNLNMYELCLSLTDKVSSNVDCSVFIEKSYSESNQFYACDFDENNGAHDEEYFIYIMAINNGTTNVFLNTHWFHLNVDLLPTMPTEKTYSECMNILTSIDTGNVYPVIPCDANPFSPIKEPTNPVQQIAINQTKPEDSVDNEDMDDPEDTKPKDWDEEAANIILIVCALVIVLCLLFIGTCYLKKRKGKEYQGTVKQKETFGRDEEEPIVPSAPMEDSEDDDNYNCMICCERRANIALSPCGHVTYCSKCCANALNQTNNQCPACRKHVTMTMKIYVAGLRG
eukprot:719375_1